MTGQEELRLRNWQGIEVIDPPIMRHEFDDLLKMAQSMLAARVKGFPALIASGEKSEVAARDEIALFEDLVADWTFIASAGSEGEPASPASIGARRVVLDRSIAAVQREEQRRLDAAIAAKHRSYEFKELA